MGAGANASGRSRGGSATKIVALVDALGYLVRFEVVSGRAHDLAGVAHRLDELEVGAPVGDKAFDADWLLEDLEKCGSLAAVPSKSSRKIKRDHDREMYKWRCQIENYFSKIKKFRVIATRYCETVASFRAVVSLVAGVIAAR